MCCIGNARFSQYNSLSDFLGLNLLKYFWAGLDLCSSFVKKLCEEIWVSELTPVALVNVPLNTLRGCETLATTRFESAHN